MLNLSYMAVYIGVIFYVFTNIFHLDVERNNLNTYPLLSSFMPFFTLLLLIGGSIVLTLSYVSWRKYKGTEDEKKSQKRNMND